MPSEKLTPLYNLPDEALVREAQLLTILPWSRVTHWRRVKSGQFPKPMMLGPRTKCWRWGEVREWLNSQKAAA